MVLILGFSMHNGDETMAVAMKEKEKFPKEWNAELADLAKRYTLTKNQLDAIRKESVKCDVPPKRVAQTLVQNSEYDSYDKKWNISDNKIGSLRSSAADHEKSADEIRLMIKNGIKKDNPIEDLEDKKKFYAEKLQKNMDEAKRLDKIIDICIDLGGDSDLIARLHGSAK
jgi:hypothetical protein